MLTIATGRYIGSLADLFDDFTLMSAFGGKADVNLLEIEKIRSQLTARSYTKLRDEVANYSF